MLSVALDVKYVITYLVKSASIRKINNIVTNDILWLPKLAGLIDRTKLTTIQKYLENDHITMMFGVAIYMYICLIQFVSGARD